MRTINISLRTIRQAVVKGTTVSRNWQASLLEILRIPAIAKRWQELNQRLPGLTLEYHQGEPDFFETPEACRAVTDWSKVAGYTVSGQYWRWNSVRQEYYGHCASTAWDGVRRETICRFVEALYFLALGHGSQESIDTLTKAKIKLTGV